MAPFGAHQQQIRHVGAGHQQDDADRGQQDPQRIAHVSDDVLLEGSQRRCPPRLYRRILQPDREHASDIGVRLRQRDVALQTRNAVEPEARDEPPAVDLQWPDDVLLAAKTELGRHHTNDLMRTGVDVEGPPDDVAISTEPP